jgi:GDP-L-fucose synthase
MNKNSSVLLTGASGMVGAATLRLLNELGFENILTPSRREVNLIDQQEVFSYFNKHQIDYVLMIAAKVGGISANFSDPVGFLDENMRIALNLFAACDRFKTKKNLFLGSSCIYPKECLQPMKEEYLLTGPLEPTNEGYALAKIAGLKLASYYHRQRGLITVCPMPCNIYGTGDHFNLENAHVLSSLVRRFVDARDEGAESVTLWGTGAPRREFIHVDDVGRAILFFMENVETSEHINLGQGTDISINELAQLIATQVGYTGLIKWDSSKPDGMQKKCLDVTRMNELGFSLSVSLVDGIKRTIHEYEVLKITGVIIK